MASSKTEICNMAISHLGTGKEIANLDTEKSEEAAACRRFYDVARDATLREFPWPFATKIAALNLISENPTDEWNYSYRVPSDCLHEIRILSGIRNDNRQSRVPYRILKDDAGLIIYTDEENATLEYIQKVTDPQFYPSDFTLALSYRIAHFILPKISKGDPFGMRQSIFDLYNSTISTARKMSVITQQDEQEVQSELERSRD